MQVGHRDPPRAEREARRPYVSFQQFDSNLQHFLSALADLSPSLLVMEICASQGMSDTGVIFCTLVRNQHRLLRLIS